MLPVATSKVAVSASPNRQRTGKLQISGGSARMPPARGSAWTTAFGCPGPSADGKGIATCGESLSMPNG